MNLLGRLFWVLLRGLLGKKMGVLDESRVKFRTWFHDLDTNIHMNNGRFLQLMDLGRTDLMVRCGMLGPVLREGWRPVVASVHISYRRPLAPLQKFTLCTRIVHWDEKWFFIEQEFRSGGKVCAQALVKATILGGRSSVGTDKIVAAVSPGATAPELPSRWRDVVHADAQLKKQLE